MDTTTLIIIAVAAVAIVAIVAWAVVRGMRHKRLKDRFGPEYDRVKERAGSRGDAADELEQRQERRQEFDIRPLDEASAERYRERWREVQSEFVDTPETAIHDADDLIQEVMRERGYPVNDFEQRASDLSVDHPEVVQHYREGHGIVERHRDSDGRETEDLRQAMLHYRRLFEELVGGTQTSERERQTA